MNVLTFDVFKNTIIKHDGFIPSTAEKNYTQLLFRFKENDDWSKCGIITASFYISADNIVKSDAELMSDDLTVTFKIPPEFTGQTGDIKLGLQGSYYDENGKEVTPATDIVIINRNKGVVVTAGANADLYEKIILLIQQYFNNDKEQINTFINEVNATLANVYTKTEMDIRLSNKIDNTKGSVSTGNLEDGAITTVKIADDSIKESHIKNYAVGTEKLADGAVTKDKIEYGAVGEEELATELLNLIKSKLDASKIESQVSTISTNATSGSQVALLVNDKKWFKDTIIKVTVSANESVVEGVMTLGIKYEGDTDNTQIAKPQINEEVTYALTSDTREIGVYIPKEHVLGNGEVTLTVETLGLKSDVAMLFSSILDIIETLTKKAETDNVYSKTESDKLFLTSVSTSNIDNEAITVSKLSEEIVDTINSKVDSAEVKAQTSTVVTNAVSGSQVAFWAPDKKWVKDTVIKITVSADESVINGTVTLGVKYDGDTSSTQIDTLINEEVTYLLTADTREIGVYIPKEHVVGDGEVTLTVESLGVRAEIVELRENISEIELDIENLREETPIAKSSIEGKTFSVIGDSCSAYASWVPEGQKSYYGNPDENETNVTSVSQMWWYILSSQLKMSLLVNDSWMGTTISTSGYKDSNGNHTDMTASAFTTRAKSTLCENNTTLIKPDYIFIFGGTNDKRAGAPVGELKYSDWTTEDLKSVLPSFCKLINDIQLYNPQATIINITFDELIGSGIDSGYAEACEHYGIINVVLSDIVQADGHPTRESQLSIAEQVIEKLREIDSSVKTYIDVSEVGL